VKSVTIYHKSVNRTLLNGQKCHYIAFSYTTVTKNYIAVLISDYSIGNGMCIDVLLPRQHLYGAAYKGNRIRPNIKCGLDSQTRRLTDSYRK